MSEAPVSTRISAAEARLFGMEDPGTGRRAEIGTVRVVHDGRVPELVMFEGEPFLYRGASDSQLLYVKTVPFRADDGLLVRRT
jgi:hypothetical protein